MGNFRNAMTVQYKKENTSAEDGVAKANVKIQGHRQKPLSI